MNDALGHVTHHMALHIATMNVVVPLAAWMLRDVRLASLDRHSAGLGLVAALQLGLLWLLHVPAAFSLMGTSPLFAAPMHVALLAISFVFWRQVFAVAAARGRTCLVGGTASEFRELLTTRASSVSVSITTFRPCVRSGAAASG